MSEESELIKDTQQEDMLNITQQENKTFEGLRPGPSLEPIDKPFNKLFKGLKKLYKFYNIKSCPSGYKIIMSKPTKKGKRARYYELIKDDVLSDSFVGLSPGEKPFVDEERTKFIPATPSYSCTTGPYFASDINDVSE